MKATTQDFLISLLAGIYSRTPGRDSQMRRYLLLLACLAAALLLWSGCECEHFVGGRLISEESATWIGVNGQAVTLWLESGTEELQGAERVSFHFKQPAGGSYSDIADFTVPVMKTEGQDVTLFFPDDPSDQQVLSELPARLKAGELLIQRCYPARVC